MQSNLLPENISLPASAIGEKPSHTCPCCNQENLSIFYTVQNVPVHSCLMLPSKDEALNFPCGDVVLGFCHNCGFITNTAFDPQWSAYASNYEDQQSFSPTFNRFAQNLAEHLIQKYNLKNKDIVEIGCSKGDFLLLLCELGLNRGVGIDPSVVPGRVDSKAANRVQFVQEYYSEEHAKYIGDFICCRHTLEHIYPTAKFLRTVRRSIGNRDNVCVFFEIPDTTRVLKDQAFEDIYYEHCSYFTPGSLARLFRASGFEVKDLYRAYDNQYLLIEAYPVENSSAKLHCLEEDLEELLHDVENFAKQIQHKLFQWQSRLQELQKQEKRVVVWGSGSKCVAFFTTLGIKEEVQYVVDINPYRQGKFIPGVGKQIMPPEFLKDYQPDIVIVMNSIYVQEIHQKLNEFGVSTKIMSI